MATIGALGSTVFHVSSNTVNTFENLSIETNTNYAVHDRHITGAILEFTGNAPDTCSFEMFFSVFLGVNPVAQINNLIASQRAGIAMMLIIGPYRYGTRWVITATNNTFKNFGGHGELLIAKQKVSLKAYN